MGNTIDRRRFIQGAAVAGGAAALSGRLIRPAKAAAESSTGIDHIVVVTMENRSFDHFLGWLPNADGLRSSKKRFPTKDGELIGNYRLTEPMGCGHPDPDHSYEGGRFQLNNGKLNNFAKGANDLFAVGYYEASDRPFMSQLALNYTTCDRYFCGIMAETYPNRFYTHSGATDRLHNSTVANQLPTIWDQLNQPGGPTGRYYFSDVPFLALYGSGKYIPISAFFPQFVIDCAGGTLPNVSYIDPRFVDEGSGTSGDDHPHADIHAGDSWLASVFNAVATSPNWNRTVMIITYDEWGGFYDHVHPPRATASSKVDTDLVGGKALLGYRVPCIIASPWTVGNPKHPRVIHNLYDHTSLLKFIESNFKLKPVQRRDASRLPTDPGDLATALGRVSETKVSKSIPPFLAAPVVMPCSPLNPGPLASLTGSGPPALQGESWRALQDQARKDGWEI